MHEFFFHHQGSLLTKRPFTRKLEGYTCMRFHFIRIIYNFIDDHIIVSQYEKNL